jgi:putative nucleotidyltransferase with HDIG domain
MSDKKEPRKSFVYQSVITFAGISLWLWSLVGIGLSRTGTELLALLAVLPLVLAASIFPITFPSPAGAKVTSNKISFTLTDALVFLVACLYGSAPAILLAGLEGFVGSRRAVKRLSSNLFSSSMMSLAAGSAAVALGAVLRHGFGEQAGETKHTFLAIAVALLMASLVHLVVNVGLLSTLFALRLDSSILSTVKRNLLWAVPMFVPTGTAASLMFVALEQGVAIVVVIGAPVLLAVYFVHRQYRDSVQERIQLIETANRERLEATEKAHRQTIEALAVAINAKDEVTHEHVLRVQIYAAGVARLLGCTESEVEALRAGALLHDIGKIAVPDYILNKPGKLTAAEFDKMKLHTIAGAQILGRVEFPYPVVPVVRSHHERWDGRGYPDGLRGEEIPLTARILSVVDCFDAVREDRQYRKGLTRAEAIDLIMQGSGTQYDPRVVGTFVTHLPEFEAEIQAHRDAPLPTYGIAPLEALSDAALSVAPAAGLASETNAGQSAQQQASSVSAVSGDEAEREALSHLALTFASARSVEELSQVLTVNLASLVPFETCALTLAHDATGEHRVVHASGLDGVQLVGRAIKTGDGVTGWALANRRPFCNTDPKLDLPEALAAAFAAYRTLAVFPLIKEDEMHGALTLYSTTLAEYDARHQRLLQQVATLFAAALSDLRARATQTNAPFNLPPAPLQLAPLESELTH